jgi:hypothetical protein
VTKKEQEMLAQLKAMGAVVVLRPTNGVIRCSGRFKDGDANLIQVVFYAETQELAIQQTYDSVRAHRKRENETDSKSGDI